MRVFLASDARWGATEGVVGIRVGYVGETMSEPAYRDLDDRTEIARLRTTLP